jgi:phosphate-selective porin OprO/OprP
MPHLRDLAGARTVASSLLAVLVAALAITGLPRPARGAEPTTPAEPDETAAAAGEARAPSAEPSIQEQIEALRQQLLILERKAEIAAEAEAEAEAEKAKTGAGVTASGKDGFSLRSNDGNFPFRLRGYAQLDGRVFVDDDQRPATDTFLLRRARPTFEGTIYKRFGFRVMPDFGTNATLLQDLFIEWTLSPKAVLRAGKLKPPVALERLQSASETPFVERALPSNLVPNRDLGVQLGGQLAGGKLEYAVGVFNGVVDGGNVDLDTNDGKDLAGRLWVSPWKGTPSDLAGLAFGIGATSGRQQGTPANPVLAGYRTAGQQTFFSYRSDASATTPATAANTVVADGTRFRLSPQAVFYRGPLGLLGEYVQASHEVRRGAATAELTHRSWQVQGIWSLTGDSPSYRWYTPTRPFDPDNPDPAKRGWGGLAVVARYNVFEADEASFPIYANSASSASEATGWAVGLDWTLQKQVRLLLDYEVTSFEGGAASGAREDEKVLFTRFQIGW